MMNMAFLFFSDPNMQYLSEILLSAIVFTMVANAGVLVAFYFNTKYQLRKHDKDIECLMQELKQKADTVSLDDLKRDLNQKFACIDDKLNNIYDHLINHKY